MAFIKGLAILLLVGTTPLLVKKSGICSFTMKLAYYGFEGFLESKFHSTKLSNTKKGYSFAQNVGKNSMGLLTFIHRKMSVLTAKKL